ncbi:hypothetical protein [Bosea sp. LjRoot237]|uniref:hypothetical protein n=1 Tax=Bosea sp. LjRoot237 TaxID=3342292 RepID=UPI003ECF9438
MPISLTASATMPAMRIWSKPISGWIEVDRRGVSLKASIRGRTAWGIQEMRG